MDKRCSAENYRQMDLARQELYFRFCRLTSREEDVRVSTVLLRSVAES